MLGPSLAARAVLRLGRAHGQQASDPDADWPDNFKRTSAHVRVRFDEQGKIEREAYHSQSLRPHGRIGLVVDGHCYSGKCGHTRLIISIDFER